MEPGLEGGGGVDCWLFETIINVSDADGMKNIWRKYMEKLLNVENDWDGEVDCPEVMVSHFGRRGCSSY